MVTETVELVKGCVLEDCSRVNARSRRVNRKELSVPKGSVLAYRRKQLVFRENSWGEQRLKEAGGEQGSVSSGDGKTTIRQPWLLHLFRGTFLSCQGTHIPTTTAPQAWPH